MTSFYANQLIFFRANLFIAPALKLGLTGYTAFVVGSSISFSVFFLITFLTLETLFHSRVKSLFLTSFAVPSLKHKRGRFRHRATITFGKLCLCLVDRSSLLPRAGTKRGVAW